MRSLFSTFDATVRKMPVAFVTLCWALGMAIGLVVPLPSRAMAGDRVELPAYMFTNPQNGMQTEIPATYYDRVVLPDEHIRDFSAKSDQNWVNRAVIAERPDGKGNRIAEIIYLDGVNVSYWAVSSSSPKLREWIAKASEEQDKVDPIRNEWKDVIKRQDDFPVSGGANCYDMVYVVVEAHNTSTTPKQITVNLSYKPLAGQGGVEEVVITLKPGEAIRRKISHTFPLEFRADWYLKHLNDVVYRGDRYAQFILDGTPKTKGPIIQVTGRARVCATPSEQQMSATGTGSCASVTPLPQLTGACLSARCLVSPPAISVDVESIPNIKGTTFTVTGPYSSRIDIERK